MPTGIYDRSFLIRKGKIIKCKRCDKERYIQPCQFTKAKYCSSKCQRLSSLNTGVPWNKGLKGFQAGEKHGMWAGDNVGYGGVHIWITKQYGKANRCENRIKQYLKFPCNEKVFIYEWSNKSEKYKRDITDWQQLCKSCHSRYDYKPEQGKKHSKFMQGRPSPKKGKKYPKNAK